MSASKASSPGGSGADGATPGPGAIHEPALIADRAAPDRYLSGRVSVPGGESMGVTSFAYKLVLLLHITSAIIGFGGVLLNGVYASRAKKRPPAEALAVVEDNTWVSMRVAEIFIYLTAVFGLGLVGLSDKVWKFSQTWVWVALVVYIVGLGISHGRRRGVEARAPDRGHQHDAPSRAGGRAGDDDLEARGLTPRLVPPAAQRRIGTDL
jgi:uncharacterized membrane protein